MVHDMTLILKKTALSSLVVWSRTGKACFQNVTLNMQEKLFLLTKVEVKFQESLFEINEDS